VSEPGAPLIAFVGPSISRAEAERLCPGLDVRPPARRDDLYRAREGGAWGFLLVDGVFMQDDAVSPREVVDVLTDGALVVGAASMGALRAADCWPAGAQGVGLIYRLYRRGVLESDADVAVAVSTDGSDAAVSLPLVNVRYAVAQAVRRRVLDRAAARRIVSAAATIHYPERSWREVFRRAGPLPFGLADFVTPFDLKRRDAERALAVARVLVGNAPELARRHGRRGVGAFARAEATRERDYDATAGVDPGLLRSRLGAWLVGSGRLERHLPGVLDQTNPDLDEIARSAWQALERTQRLDGELMRLRAMTCAVETADAAGLAPRARDLNLAQDEIARNHGAGSWDRLLASPRGRRHAGAIATARDRLARAKRMREVWFAESAKTAEGGGARRAPRAWQKVRALLRRRPTRA
jgi:hypothetical protein